MSIQRIAVIFALAPLGACLADTSRGDLRADGVTSADGVTDTSADGVTDTSADGDDLIPGDGSPSDGTPSDGTPSDGTPSDGTPSDGTPSDGTADGADATPADSGSDTTADTAPAPVCGDHLVGPGEACDDGNACQGDGCAACRPEPTLVVTRLQLHADAGFDLDDLDQDANPYTGIDNRLGASPAIAAAFDDYIRGLIESGELIQLLTFTARDGADLDLTLHPGHDPECRPTGAWREGPFNALHASRFPECTAPVSMSDAHIADARLFAEAPHITVPLGALGSFTIARAQLEGPLAYSNDRVRVLEGELGGVLPASALMRIDVSDLLPECPTALHAVLGLAGHLDQDADGDGRVDFIRWVTEANTTPCINGPVVISGCCVDGLCDDAHLVPGRDCALDPRVTDGYSIGFGLRAHAAIISDADDHCSP